MIKIGDPVDFILNNARFHGTVSYISEEEEIPSVEGRRYKFAYIFVLGFMFPFRMRQDRVALSGDQEKPFNPQNSAKSLGSHCKQCHGGYSPLFLRRGLCFNCTVAELDRIRAASKP